MALVLPGDYISPKDLPKSSGSRSGVLKLGPGLRHLLPDIISPTVAGELCIDNKKNALWVEGISGRVRKEIAGNTPYPPFQLLPLFLFSPFPSAFPPFLD